MGIELVKELTDRYKSQETVEVLKGLSAEYAGEIVFTTSFGIEDQVITDLIFRNDLPIKVVTLDTGRLFEETNKVFARTIEKYGKTIYPYYPKNEALEKFIAEKGPNSFYSSLENRKQCCHIRKVEPLGRALSGMKCWITGLRADQSQSRHELGFFDWDGGFNLVKYNPLLEWSFEDCKAHVNQFDVPYNTLHDKGFVSIGCAPCTRAIQPGEDFRAGRWWWESNSKKECGLHIHK